MTRLVVPGGSTSQRTATPVRYLSCAEVAARIGVKPNTLGRYRLPEPDAWIGHTRGWLPETIDRWNDSRPSKRS